MSASIRQRRLLSTSRRAGLQLEADAAAGRAQRHAQGWRDQQHDDSLDAPTGIVAALGYSALAWACIGLVGWIVMGLA